MHARLLLSDGTHYEGLPFGKSGTAVGEVVFNTAMCGYQEILTDPSYHGQLVTMTYPQIGNYGVNPKDVESGAPRVAGFIVREYARPCSHWRANRSWTTTSKSTGSWASARSTPGPSPGTCATTAPNGRDLRGRDEPAGGPARACARWTGSSAATSSRT